MCGRYYNRKMKQELAERLRAKKVDDQAWAPDYNIAPSTFQPIVRNNRDDGERELVLARWGLVPIFAKTLADWPAQKTFNARAETVTSKPTWKRPFTKGQRCLVPFDGFYEWKTVEEVDWDQVPDLETQIARDQENVESNMKGLPLRWDNLGRPIKGRGRPKPRKVPFNITTIGSERVAFAGLFDAWRDPTVHGANTWLQSFTIITTIPNELMAQIHDRMPVILPERDWERWLDRDPDAPPPLDLLRPYDADAMTMAPCNPAVGNVRNNGPEMLVCPTPDTPPLNSA